MENIRLWSTDFDGTLISHEPHCPPELDAALAAHKAGGGLWVVNTGRDFDYACEGLEEFAASVTPDFLMTNEREIFRANANGQWEDYGDWNRRCTETHDRLFAETAEFFTRTEKHFAQRRDFEIIRDHAGRFVGIVAPAQDELAKAIVEIKKFADGHPDISFQHNSVFLRFCHAGYDKGVALAELCRLENLVPAEVFAVGDQPNDISMLTPRYAAALACPANAADEVKAAVLRGNGFVAPRPYGLGVVDAIEHFEFRLT